MRPLATTDLAAPSHRPLPEPAAPAILYGDDSPLIEVLRSCSRIAASDATVLITGETGTGKEVLARYVHARSRRAGRALVPVNCGAIPEALLESELFGHVRGAFTGAAQSRRGRVAYAEGGTLFLDEIGELPLALQVKLLRLLQDRHYEPIGSNESVAADFRLIAATNRDLEAEVAAGRFRRDLYYRLLVCPIELPGLRQRPMDIAPLFLHFWNLRGGGRPVEPAVLEVLACNPWPGNVRELENLVERLAVLSEGPTLRLADLPASFRQGRRPTVRIVPRAPEPEPFEVRAQLDTSAREDDVVDGLDEAPALPPAQAPASFSGPAEASLGSASELVEAARAELPLPLDLPALLRDLECTLIDRALTLAGGNRKEAASMLGLQRTTLVEKLRRRNKGAPSADGA